MASLNNKENINPAIIHNEETPNEMSAEEFKRTLITWFEDRGLLSELRAHLRRQMIGILKGTTMGQSVAKTNAKMSPKAHVMNLLIAEFLLKHRYHYSLSVFSTEVPFFISVLPEFSSTLINPNILNEDNPSNTRNFTQQNFWDILQTLGFSTESHESEKLYAAYFNSNEQSLLTCMIRLLAKSCKWKNKLSPALASTSTDVAKLEPWVKDIHNLLVHYEVPCNFLTSLRDQLKLIFEREQTKIKTEEHSKYNNQQALVNIDMHNRETEIQRIISEMEETYFKERQKMSENLEKEQNYLEKLKIQLKQQKYEYEIRNDNIQKREEVLKERERELDEQLSILKTRMKVMQNVYDSVIDENKKIIQLRQDLEHQESNAEEAYQKLHKEYILLRGEIHTTKKVIDKFNGSEPQYAHKEVQTLQTADGSEAQLLKGMLERIQNENAALRLLNSEQQRRLDDVSIRNAMLVNDLENCQATINILTRTNSRRGMITVPPILPSPPSFAARAASRPVSSLNGGGENLGFVPQPPQQPVYRYAYSHQFRDYIHRKAPKRLVVHGSSSSSSSPTEDILQEARQRLRRLEEESEEVDRHYRAFRERQAQENYNQMQPPLPTFSVHNLPESVLRLRNTNENAREMYPAVAINVNNRPIFGRAFQFEESVHRLNQIPPRNSVNYMDRAHPSSSINGLTVIPNQYHFAAPNRTLNSMNNPSVPSTSYEFNFSRDAIGQADAENQIKVETTREENRVSTGPSAASSGISQLQNVSISSIDVSSDSGEGSDDNEEKEPTNERNN